MIEARAADAMYGGGVTSTYTQSPVSLVSNNGKPQSGAAALKRAASKRKTAKAKSSKR